MCRDTCRKTLAHAPNVCSPRPPIAGSKCCQKAPVCLSDADHRSFSGKAVGCSGARVRGGVRRVPPEGDGEGRRGRRGPGAAGVAGGGRGSARPARAPGPRTDLVALEPVFKSGVEE